MVIVVVLTACPAGLRGDLTRWLLEISPGVFTGDLPARVRDTLWDRVTDLIGPGRALMLYSSDGEQHLAFRVHGHDWTPEDNEGILLMRRPPHGNHTSSRVGQPPPENWSIAARRRRFGARLPTANSEE
jgi:CRISPR-associated protein Cas2